MADAKKNALIIGYGTPKTGKTNLGTRTNRRLFYAHFDPHNNLDDHLLARKAEGFTSDVYPKFYYPVAYKNLTSDSAEATVRDLEAFAADARAMSEKDGIPGLFVIDGGKRLKGYIEKWLLGQSSTLGFRASAGEKGVSQVEYAASNAYFADIINAFVGTNCSLYLTVEAREKWVETTPEGGGRKVRKPSGKYEAKIPNDVGFSINAMVETLVEAVQVAVVDNKGVFEFQHKIRFELVGAVGMGYMKNRTIPACSFDDLVTLLQSAMPEAANTVVEPKHEIKRMDMDDSLAPAEVDE